MVGISSSDKGTATIENLSSLGSSQTGEKLRTKE